MPDRIGRDYRVLRPGLICGAERAFGEIIPAEVIAGVSEPSLSAMINGGYIEAADGSGRDAGATDEVLHAKVDALAQQVERLTETISRLTTNGSGGGVKRKAKPKPRTRR